MALNLAHDQLRADTEAFVRRAQRGERFRITIDGRPVAELGPVRTAQTFVSRDVLRRQLAGLLRPDDRLDEELRDADSEPGAA